MRILRGIYFSDFGSVGLYIGYFACALSGRPCGEF